MRQVPHYLIIGNGRLARHFSHYLTLLRIAHESWHRTLPLAHLTDAAKLSTHSLLLISDQAIEPFLEDHAGILPAITVHCSGSLVTQKAYGAHPLTTFTANSLYELQQYKNIPFILDEDAPPFEELLPGLPNHHVRLKKIFKEKYHALCVLAGNFSCLLWKKLFDDFESQLNLSPNIAHVFLRQLTENLIHNPKSALTGPLVRKDQATIEKNIAALKEDPFGDVYESFVSCFKKIN